MPLKSVMIRNRTATFRDIVGSPKLEQYYARIKKIMDVNTLFLENAFVRLGKSGHINTTLATFEQIEKVEVINWRELDNLIPIFMEKLRHYVGLLTTYEARMAYSDECDQFEMDLKSDILTFKRSALDYVENSQDVHQSNSRSVNQKKDELDLKSQLGLLSWGETAQRWLLKIPGTVSLLESCFL